VADKSARTVLDALSRAVVEPAGAPLHATRTSPGLFPATALGRKAAHFCKEEGLVAAIEGDREGADGREPCAITDRGLAYLLEHGGARQLLEDLVRAAEARQGQMDELVRAARRTEASCAALKTIAAKVLAGGERGDPAWAAVLLAHLERRRAAEEDCPLPELYRVILQTEPSLSVGQFHDALRQLHDRGRVYLHPWTGPLYDLPEPPFALLVGHEVAYYASLRT
jgi:hypothetical protein